jgi:hypothetical protein
LTAPIRWAGDVVTLPFRSFHREPALAPVGERVIVTRTVKTNGCHYRLHRKKAFKRVTHVRRVLPAVGERTTMVRTVRTHTWMD